MGCDSGALDDYVPTANIDKISTFRIGGYGIEDVIAIEDFSDLIILICDNNQIKSFKCYFKFKVKIFELCSKSFSGNFQSVNYLEAKPEI